jgi:protein-S-isoprenylcysteine O-methyltransferase Ste14
MEAQPMKYPTMIQTAYAIAKQQRLAWSCAIIVGLFLVLVGHAPALPVLMGCVLAVAFAVLRSWSRVTMPTVRRSTK